MSVFSNRKTSIKTPMKNTDYVPESAWKTHISFERVDQNYRNKEKMQTELANIAIKLAEERD